MEVSVLRKKTVCPMTAICVAAGISSANAFWNPFGADCKQDARAQYEYAQELRRESRYNRAMDAYQLLVDEYPDSPFAAESQFQVAEMLLKTGHHYAAYNAYQAVLDEFPSYPRVNLILERQMSIGNYFLHGKQNAFLRFNPAGAYKRAIEIFSKVIFNAPFSDVAPEAQYHLGMSYKKLERYVEAAIEFDKIPLRYPLSRFVEEAQYQRAECACRQAQNAPYDQELTSEAITHLKRYREKYPEGTYAGTVERMLDELTSRKAGALFRIGRYYRERENSVAAILYFEEVVSHNPGSSYAEKARREMDRERKKLELSRAVREARKQVEDCSGEIRRQRGAIAEITGKGALPWCFWRYLFHKPLSEEERAEVVSLRERISALETECEEARRLVRMRTMVKENRLRALMAQARVEEAGEELRAMREALQETQKELSARGELSGGDKIAGRVMAERIARREARIREKEQEMEELRAAARRIEKEVALKEENIRDQFRADGLAEKTDTSREDAGTPPPAGGDDGEGEDNRWYRWFMWWKRDDKGRLRRPCDALLDKAIRLLEEAREYRAEDKKTLALLRYDEASRAFVEAWNRWPECRRREIEEGLRHCREGMKAARGGETPPVPGNE